MIEKDFQRLAFLARCETSLTNALCRTGPVGFGDRSPEENLACVKSLRQALADRPILGQLFDHFLIVQRLLHPTRLPPDWWAAVLADIPVSAHPVGPEIGAAGVWRDVPVLIADSRTCYARRFIIAVLPGDTEAGPADGPVTWPEWADPLLSDGAKAAIADAGAACADLLPDAASRRFFLFPLVPPNGRIQIDGRSLGLPLALGFLSAAEDARLPDDIAATGAVSAGGAVSPVGGMEVKRRASMDNGFTALLCPSENARLMAAKTPPPLLPVADLRQAWMVARLYEPGRADRLIRFSMALKDPRSLIEALDEVDPEWLEWVRRQGYARPASQAVSRSPRLLAALTDRLEGFARRSDTARADAAAALLPPERFDSGREDASLSAFRWCAANLSIANHRGRISGAADWTRRAGRFLDAAGRADIPAVVDYFNHLFVARHNRYHFRPEPPGEVRRYLDLLERQYAVQCEFGCPTHPVLGRLYGSISQNYGFCGPGFLERMWGYCEKARRALGEGTVPEFKEEWARHYNYMTYALLDAGDRKRAAAIFFTYLECDDPEAIFGRLAGFTPWEHALSARLLAGTGGAEAPRYLDWCDAHLKTPPGTEHPWQLWCVNLGRIAAAQGAEATAEGWFRKGLALCRSPAFGATVRVMALLPLSGLHALERLDGREMRAERDAIMAAAGKLHPGYFDGVFSVPFERALDAVWRHPERLFPFNYR